MQFWIQSFTGHAIDLQNVRCQDVRAPDVVHSAAGMNRWDFATRVPISNAQHMLNVAREVLALTHERNWSVEATIRAYRKALMHDGHEYITGDVKSPVKWLPFMEGFRAWEKDVERVFEERFLKDVLEPCERLIVKEADERVARAEANAWMEINPWIYEGPRALSVDLAEYTWREIYEKYRLEWNRAFPEETVA